MSAARLLDTDRLTEADLDARELDRISVPMDLGCFRGCSGGVRATLNGLQPREAREIAPDAYDWTDAPLFARPPEPDDGLTAADVALLAVGFAAAAVALAVKFGVAP